MRPSAAVERLHRRDDAVGDDVAGGVRRRLDGLRRELALVRVERRKHVLEDFPALGRPADADAYACEVRGAEMFDDRSHAAMTAGAAFRTDAKPPERQVEVVVDGDEARGRKAEIL